MKKRIIAGGLVAASVAAAVALVWVLGVDPSGMATGSRVRKADRETIRQAVWNELAAHDETYLAAYADYFQEGDRDPLEMLSAFNELAYQVTGAGGLWRETVPNKYFGCQVNEDFEICMELKRAEETFAQWDAFQERAAEVDGRLHAARFIILHGDEMRAYMRIFVPGNESLSAVQATPFFAKNFAPSLAGM